MRSNDGRQALIVAHVNATGGTSAQDNAKTIIDKVGSGNAVLGVVIGGQLAVGLDTGTQVSKDLGKAEGIAVPLTLILLFVAFGSLVAAPLPLAIGVVAIFGTFAELFVVSQFTDVSIFAINLATAMGLGLGIDYALLIVSRFREELNNGSTEEALVKTLTTAGRTIIFSSLTVAVALSALLVFPLYFLRSFAYAGIGVVIIALLSALFILPAILALLGPKVNALRIRRNRPLRSASQESRFWGGLATRVMRHPILFAVPVIALLLLAGSPFLHASFGIPDDRVLPTSLPSRQVGDALRSNFPSGSSTALAVVIDGTASHSQGVSYAEKISTLTSVQRVDSAEGTFSGGNQTGPPSPPDAAPAPLAMQSMSVIGPADTQSAASQTLVGAIRALPAPGNSVVYVGGPAADLVDGNNAIGEKLPLALAIIAITTFILLFLFTGSVVLPVKALVLNLLSLTAVFGAMVWIFQDGHGSGLLGFTPGLVNTSMPVLLFCVAFGLSMDYEVFLLSRIKEFRDSGLSNQDAVIKGLAHTGRIITTAAALLSVTFLAFMVSQVSFMQLFGLGTAIAIIADATLIRGVLVPAFMRLAGNANWWAPPFLRKVHQRFGITDAA
jgi:RND superfamily putative drug exporter